MTLRTWLAEWKLARVESKIKALHVRQRMVRDKERRLDADRKKGGMTAEAHATEYEKLEAQKRQYTERLNALTAEEQALKAALKAAQASRT